MSFPHIQVIFITQYENNENLGLDLEVKVWTQRNIINKKKN